MCCYNYIDSMSVLISLKMYIEFSIYYMTTFLFLLTMTMTFSSLQVTKDWCSGEGEEVAFSPARTFWQLAPPLATLPRLKNYLFQYVPS